MSKILVSVIIPCRNEEKYIGRCLDSIIGQDYPKEKLEVLVMDGMSEDRTREIIKNFQFSNSDFQIKLIDNPQKFTPFGLNIGIKNSKGEVIIRMDSHAAYQKDYISKCLSYLEKYKADNVGGIIKTIPAEDTLIARAIAVCLSHFFGVGNSYFRTGSKKPKWVDTVFGGCYRKEVFDKMGLFNENLIRSQDMEFNLRLKRKGGKILLAPDIVSYYYPKSKLGEFFIHNFKDGFWGVFPLKFVKMPLSWRHYIPLFFVLTLPISIWPYLLINLYFSSKVAIKEKEFGFLFALPIVFAVRHFGYGLGSLWGLIKLIL